MAKFPLRAIRERSKKRNPREKLEVSP